MEKQGRVHHVRFVPRGESGESIPVEILYGGTPINGSPFVLKLARSSFPENVRVLGSADGDNRKILIKAADLNKLRPTNEETTVVVDTRGCGKCKSLGVDVIVSENKIEI